MTLASLIAEIGERASNERFKDRWIYAPAEHPIDSHRDQFVKTPYGRGCDAYIACGFPDIARHIARMDPTTTLALLRVIERQNEALQVAADMDLDDYGATETARSIARAALSDVEQAVKEIGK